VLYNFRGSEVSTVIMLYGGGGLSKNQHFCYIICGRPPKFIFVPQETFCILVKKPRVIPPD